MLDVLRLAENSGRIGILENWLATHDSGASTGELVKTWIAAGVAEHEWLRVVGFQERHKIRLRLDEVFVPLRVRAGWRRGRPGLKGSKLDDGFVESQEVDLPGALRLAASVKDTVGLAVLGDPGAGKTTLLKQLFVRVACDGSASVGLPPDLVPVLLRCSRIRHEDYVVSGLANAMLREAERGGHAEAARRLANGRTPILFLLDGLDEVRDEPSRAKLCDWLGDEVARWPGSRFVVTCRFAAWRREAVLDQRFRPVDVLWLDEKAVTEYVHRWFYAVERGFAVGVPEGRVEAEAKQRAGALLATLLDPKRQASIRLREMTENPLLLSTLCLVHHADMRLPDRRADLYDRCISLLLEAWAAQREGAPTLPDKPARQVLQPLAWAMHEAEAREWPAKNVVKAIAGPLAEVPELQKLSPSTFLDRARDDCGVLGSKDLGSYEFFHLAFQEQLAATHAVEQGLAAELAKHAGEPWWREVILLAAGKPGMLRALLRAMGERGEVAGHKELLRECVAEAIRVEAEPFVELLERGLRGESGGVATARVIMAVLGERAPALVMERARNLVGHVDIELAAAARAIAGEVAIGAFAGGVLVEGWPFRDPVTEMSFLWVPPGRFWMGSSKTKGERNYDPEAYDDELPAREVTLTSGFFIAELPVTNRQYARFLEAEKAELPEFWRDRRFNDPAQPLAGVSWDEARTFCAWLGKRAGLDEGWRFDLPTEAEWEYVARNGKEGRRYPWGNEPPKKEHADFEQDWGKGKPAPAGSHPKGRSAAGALDMAGSVWEWCLDNWNDNYVDMMTKIVDPCRPPQRGAPRVVRGGSWLDYPRRLRCAARGMDTPSLRYQYLGFRVVCRPSRQHLGI